jgi:hypothetical protein
MQTFLSKNYAYGPLGVSLIALSLALLFQRFLPPQIPLFYGSPVGEEQLVPSFELIIPSILSLSINLINLLIFFIAKDDFLKKALMITSFVVAFFTLITTFKIIFLVGSF